MRRRDLIVRAAGVVLTGELIVHELRYMIAPSTEGAHGYLPLLGVLSVVALAVGAGHLAGVAERARSTGRPDRVELSFLRAWAMVAGGMLALFWAQESIEALLLGAALGAPAAPLAGGGWVAVPLACGLAAILALALTGAGAVVRAAALRARARVSRGPVRPGRLPVAATLPCFAPLALNLAGRAPPLPA